MEFVCDDAGEEDDDEYGTNEGNSSNRGLFFPGGSIIPFV